MPPKRFHPHGLEIVYEDEDILVADKVSGLLTVSTDTERDKTAYSLLNDYVRKGNSKSKKRVFVVHRLDRDTSGLIVFAKSEVGKRYLQDNWDGYQKKYAAIVCGVLNEKSGLITSYLAENRVFKMYAVDDPEKGKLAKTGYKVVKESAHYSLLELELFTGRKNQIRVHMADLGHPVAGDDRYGVEDKRIKRLTLHSKHLSFDHPYSKEKMVFESKLPAYFETLVKGAKTVGSG